jgi:hypothetical protein
MITEASLDVSLIVTAEWYPDKNVLGSRVSVWEWDCGPVHLGACNYCSERRHGNDGKRSKIMWTRIGMEGFVPWLL